MSIETGGPAFPVQDMSKWQVPGLSIRDYMAAKAMPMLITLCANDSVRTDDYPAHVANHAYRMADAMLEARNKGTP